MEENNKFELIPFNDKIMEFKQYITPLDRSIFSARFGDGKSTFLKSFQTECENDYIFFTIYPLHYQVADNKDIFEYLKRDLLLQLLSYIELKEENYSNLLALYSYISTDPIKRIEDALSIIGDCGIGDLTLKKAFAPIINIAKNIKNFKAYKKKLDEETDSKVIEDYINSFDGQKGSIYEFDLITQLICTAAKQIKEEKKKEIILVVEDLDRMDPAHIFRILNIISCHVDRTSQGVTELETKLGNNKFLFDKIILVCDYDNIRSIFQHFYGTDTDFKGYISKFTPEVPFKYSLRDLYKEYIIKQFDEELIHFPIVMDHLAKMIVKKNIEGTTSPTSLREICELLKTRYNIKDVTIPTRNTSYTIPTINPLTRVLDIMNRFSITWDSFYSSFKSNEEKDELYRLVGVCWLVETSSHTFLNVINNSIYLEYIQKYNYHEETRKIKLSETTVNISSDNHINSINIKTHIFTNHLDEYKPVIRELTNSIGLIALQIKKYIINCNI